MTLAELYLDEDTQSGAFINALRSRGITLVTTSEAGMANRTDEEQLRFAASHNRVLVTSNIADFVRLHAAWLAAGLEHGGIILIHQQKWGPGDLARRLFLIKSRKWKYGKLKSITACVNIISAFRFQLSTFSFLIGFLL